MTRTNPWLGSALTLVLGLVGCDCGGEVTTDAGSGDSAVHYDSGRVDTAVVDTVVVDATGVDTTTADTAAADTASAEDGASSEDAAGNDAAGGTDSASAVDSGATEDGGAGCVTIAELRAMADGAVDVVTCPVYVSYVRLVGFFVQEVQAGPAIYVYTNTVDPAADLSVAVGNQVTLNVTELGTFQSQKQIVWNGTSGVATNDSLTYDVVTNLAQDLSTGTGTVLGANLESELVTLANATVVSGGGRDFVITYGSGNVTADLYLWEGGLCPGATFDLVSGYVGVASATFSIRAYYAADIDNIDTSGCSTPAVVRINEVNANIAQGCDLIEIRVVTEGALDGITVKERISTVYTFPAMTVAKNNYVVLHLNGGSATCNPSSATSETTSINQQPAATYAANYDGAYDHYATSSGLIASTNVISLYDALGNILDTVFLTDDATSNVANDTETQAEAARAADAWWMADGTAAAANYFVDAQFRTNAVPGLGNTGTSATGNTIQRLNNDDTNKKGDWTSANAAPTWGANNSGQTNFP